MNFRYLRVLLVVHGDQRIHTHFNAVNYRRVHSSMESKEVVCECVCVREIVCGDKRELQRDLMNTGSNEPFVFRSRF